MKAGGHLVLGPRSGMRDKWNALYENRQPGPLEDALGGRVEQYYALIKKVPISGVWGKGNVSIWAEQMSTKSKDTKVLMRYGKSNGWLDDQPAVIQRKVGKGSITYVGGLLDEQLMLTAVRSWLDEAGVKPALGPVPEGVEVCRRTGDHGDVFILLNNNQTPVSFKLPRPMRDVLGKGALVSTVRLPVEGVIVLSDNRN